MIPDHIIYDESFNHFHWITEESRTSTNKKIVWPPLRDSEWMHVCWLVEQGLNGKQRSDYSNELYCLLPADENHGPLFENENGEDILTPSQFMQIHASWQLRATALCRVKNL